MITYKNCSEVDFDKVYRAFKIGFSDYVIQIEMPKELFEKRFFGPEGNSVEHSFIALDGEEPVGVILGGIKTYEGVKTIRCGTMCIHPEYRGKGLSQELFSRHKKLAKEMDCKQMFLEVIVGNDRAINFYKKKGYEKIYDLSYFTYKFEENRENFKSSMTEAVTELTFNELAELKNEFGNTHINWQNDFDYFEKVDGMTHYGIVKNNEIISAVAVGPNGKIYFIWTKPSERNKSLATGMLAEVKKKHDLKAYSISCPNNGNLVGYLKHLGFEKDQIMQYEMYLWQ